MAAINVFDLSGSTVTDEETTATFKKSLAASQEVPCAEKDKDLILVVENGDATHAVTVTIAVPDSGGVRVSLGDLAYTVAGNKSRAIKLSDTARYKDLDEEYIVVEGAIAEGGTIGDCKLYAIQA